jgi:hypothetical protein
VIQEQPLWDVEHYLPIISQPSAVHKIDLRTGCRHERIPAESRCRLLIPPERALLVAALRRKRSTVALAAEALDSPLSTAMTAESMVEKLKRRMARTVSLCFMVHASIARVPATTAVNFLSTQTQHLPAPGRHFNPILKCPRRVDSEIRRMHTMPLYSSRMS